jgi:carboxylesterase type B
MADANIVRTESGQVSGEGGEVLSYKGIPFAAPPVGDLRWKPPQRAASWSGVKACTAFGDDPMQNPVPSLRGPRVSEDCLTLNIWTPATRSAVLPVLVYLYGGGYALGSGSIVTYDGDALARKGAVVVTVNYRVGIFGFLAHPGLSKESSHGASGNYGLLDQIAALKWVRENIAGFGGDPGCVTLFGESAGGGSIAALLTSPLAEGLFHRAILQSPGALGPILSRAEAERSAVAALGDDIAALRAAPAQELFSKTAQAAGGTRSLFVGRPLVPIHDGWVLPEAPRGAFAAGHFHKMPMMIGGCAEEGPFFVANMPVKTLADYRAFLQGGFGKFADEALSLYPAASDAGGVKAVGDAFADVIFNYGVRGLARINAKAERRTYRFLFAQSPGGRGTPPTHVEDVPYVFGNLEAPRFGQKPPVTEKDREVSAAMMGAWLRFAAKGDPNGGGLVWQPYDPAKDNYLAFGDPIAPGAGWRTKQVDFIERILNGSITR